jgi:hypothetical protein
MFGQSIRIIQRCTPEEAAAVVAAITMFEEERDSGPSGAARPEYHSVG